ncbi:MAG: hypothetical protein ACOYYS_00125 [Chloroflexota bacterium]
MSTEFEDQYGDVLQNIEAALARVYRSKPEMTDWDTLKALDALVRAYQAEAGGHQAAPLRLNEAAQAAFDGARSMCEFRLGRTGMTDQSGQALQLPIQAVTIPEIVACLKRIKRSAEKWQKEGGRRGYYEFIRQFVG